VTRPLVHLILITRGVNAACASVENSIFISTVLCRPHLEYTRQKEKHRPRCIIADNKPARFYNTCLRTNANVKRIFIVPFTRGCMCMCICINTSGKEWRKNRSRFPQLRFRGSSESRVKHTSMLDAYCLFKNPSRIESTWDRGVKCNCLDTLVSPSQRLRIAENPHPLKLHPRAWDEGMIATGGFGFGDHVERLIVNAHRWSVLLKYYL